MYPDRRRGIHGLTPTLVRLLPVLPSTVQGGQNCLFLIHLIGRKSVPISLRYSALGKFVVTIHSCHSEEGYSETSTINKVTSCIDENIVNVLFQK